MSREFKPSLAVPLRAVQCRAPLKNGDEAGRRCKKKAILGGLVCRSHGAQLPAVQQAAARAVEDARLRLLLATEDAVVVLETLMDVGQSEAVRLRAAVEILDRAGIRGGIEIRPLPVRESPSAVLEQRLADLARRMAEGRDRVLMAVSNDSAGQLLMSRDPELTNLPIPAQNVNDVTRHL